jgi:NitT/TauT family transport system substrate-binding protein
MVTSLKTDIATPSTTEDAGNSNAISRRTLLRGAVAAGLVAPLIGMASRRALAADAKPLKLAWNAGAACLAGVAVAYHNGVFAKHNLNVELINFSGSTDALLEAIATGKADAGVGMALRWLKPLEQGFDVKLTGGTHGGCLRMLTPKASGITDITGLKGKTIAVADMGGPAKNFFSVVLAKHGIDPVKDVEWKQYPGNLLALAIEKGEAHALTDSDPLTWGFLKEGKLVEIGTNLSGEYAHRTCCLIGVRGTLLREDKPTVAALTRALLEAQQITAASPETAAEAFAQYTPKYSRNDVADMLRTHTQGEQVIGDAFRGQLVQYVEELKLAGVFKPSTDPVKFVQRVTADVLA